MAVEEEFGISIADAEAAACETPGGLIQLVTSKLDFTQKRVCPSLRGFHVVRAALIETAAVDRSQVKLNTRLRSLAKASQDLEIANRLRSVLERNGPSLSRPFWMNVLLWTAAIAVVLAAGFHLSTLASVGLGFATWIAGLLLTLPFARYFPPGTRVRDLVPYTKTSGWVARDRGDVAKLVRKIVIEQLGLCPEQYREDAHFVRDLGVD